MADKEWLRSFLEAAELTKHFDKAAIWADENGAVESDLGSPSTVKDLIQHLGLKKLEEKRFRSVALGAGSSQDVLAPSAPGAPSAPSAPGGLEEPLLTASAPPSGDGGLQPPAQHGMAPMSAQALQPWDVGPTNMYDGGGRNSKRNLGGTGRQTMVHVDPPPPLAPGEDPSTWLETRRTMLMTLGTRREDLLHRAPKCLMDQMCSGTALFPTRLLDDSWLLPVEIGMVHELEQLLQGTGRSHDLAWDMLAFKIYEIDPKIVLDNSGSMQLDMFGQPPQAGQSTGVGFLGNAYGRQATSNTDWIDQCAMENRQLLQQLLANRKRGPRGAVVPQTAPSPLSPTHRRWFFARDAMRKWAQVFRILQMDPEVLFLNSMPNFGMSARMSQVEQIFQQQPNGTTPMTETLMRALDSSARVPAGYGGGGYGNGSSPYANGTGTYSFPAASSRRDRPAFILGITDGEANDMKSFTALLDFVQNGAYGDVQICMMGLSLVPEDIEWFETEECDETRIRTVEPYEVELRQMLMREVTSKEGGYNFDMHSFRPLVTNFYPADYDYEAPLQNFRHRIYITLHGRDRWWGLNNGVWNLCMSKLCCSVCFIATGAHCCGWCQGQECGKCEYPECLKDMCGGEE